MFHFVTRLLLCTVLGAAAPALGQSEWDQRIAHGPHVTVGTLANGLTYYIRENGRPANRVVLRLVVNAGSILEEEDQRGAAHFLEHMAFNGTKHFHSTEVVDYLESIGAAFGADLNAYTSFDETVYTLEIPTDKPGLLEKGVLILRDWAGEITLDPTEIEKERGVILDEWRRGQGAASRVRKKLWPVVLRGSRYADRLPIGSAETIESIPNDRIQDFYQAWYRPELMAVIAVGDIETDRIRTLIEAQFNTLPQGEAPRLRPSYPVPLNQNTLAATAMDEELATTSFQVLFKHPAREQGTMRAYRAAIMDGLVSAMLNQRLAEIALKPNAPFLGAGSASASFARSVDMFVVAGSTPDAGAESGLKTVLVELQRAALHGFTRAELDRSKAEILSAIERVYNERDKSQSGSFVGEYTRNFLQQEPIPGIEFEFAMLKEILPTVTLDEVQADMERLLHKDNRVVTAQGSQSLPSEETLLELVASADTLQPVPYEDHMAGRELMPTRPAPGRRVATTVHEALGITEILFANGVSVWLKPTDFKNDEILIRAVGTPGLCLAPKGDYSSAKLAGPALGIAGFGGHSGLELDKLLAGKQVSVRTFIDDFSFGLAGTSTRQDLETALQLLYLSLTHPNRDEKSYRVFQSQLADYLANRENLPQVQFSDALTRLNYADHYMRQPMTQAALESLDMDTGLAFYKFLFGNAARLRFFFVGSFEVETILPLLEQYLGSLPGDPQSARAACSDPGIHFPEGTHRQRVYSGREPKARCTMTWNARAGMDEMEMFRMRMATDILEIRLRNLLREEVAGTYSVGVHYSQSPPYTGYATTSVTFGSAPDQYASMVEMVFDAIRTFKEDGPTQEEMGKVEEIERRRVQEWFKQNNYWSGSLATTYLLGWDPKRILERLSRIDALTAEGLVQDFRKYFPEDNYTVVTLLPEEMDPER